MKELLNDKNNVFIQYDSVVEFQKEIKKNPATEGFYPTAGSEFVDNREEPWSGVGTFEEADNLLQFGCKDIEKKLAKAIIQGDKCKPKKIELSVQGFAPCVPNALKGVPKTMYTIKRIPEKVRTRKIYLANTSGSCVSSEDLLKSGTVMLNVCNELERNGVRTEIYVIPKISWCSKRSHKQWIGCSVKVKGFRDNFNFTKLSYAIAHTGMFRRHGFKFMETVQADAKLKAKFTENYGYSMANHHKELKETLKEKNIIGLNDLVISYSFVKGNDYDLDKVLRALKLTK
jgi:hypothetical protein